MRTLLQPSSPPPPPATTPGIFFLRGHPRSGTNWVGNLLNLHPAVSCTGEFQLETMFHAMTRTLSLPWQLSAQEPVAGELRAAFADLVRRCVRVGCEAHRAGAAWHGDRTPSYLCHLVPDARYIWILRDGRDVLVSWTFHQLRNGREVIENSIPVPARFHLLALLDRFTADPHAFDANPEQLLDDEAWVRQIASGWAHRLGHDLRAAAEIEQSPEAGLLRVRYEDLHARPEAERERLYRFLDLDPADAAPASRETRTTPGFDRADPADFLRKGEVGDWKNYFTDRARAWFKDAAGDALANAGYETSDNW